MARAGCSIIPTRSMRRSSPAAALPTVGKLIDHIFLVERRHLQRLTDQPLDRDRPTGNNAPPLFDYGASVRRELEQFVADLTTRTPTRCGRSTSTRRAMAMTPRKLLFHILLHETRHWAQIALAVRLAGFEPPGNHDLFYSKALI